jgi:O-antigen/teichoic acid export membrane protein
MPTASADSEPQPAIDPAVVVVPRAALAAATLYRLRASSSLVRNSLVMMLTTVVNLGLGFGFWFAAAHTVSVAQVGLAGALISAISLANTLGSVGTGNALINRLAKAAPGVEWSRTLNAGLVCATTLSTLIGVVTVIVLPFAASDFDVLREPLVIAIFLLGVAAMSLTDTIDKSFVAQRDSPKMLRRNIVAGVLRVAFLLLPIAVAGTGATVFAWIVGMVVSIPFAFLLVRRVGRGYRLRAPGTLGAARKIGSTIAGNHLVSIGNISPQYIMPLVVAAILSTEKSGIFYSTWRIAGGFFVVSVAVATSLFAEISHDPAARGHGVRRAAKVIGALLIPAILGTIVLGKPVLGLLGSSYEAGYTLLIMLAVAAIPDAVTNVYVSILRSDRRFGTAGVLTFGMATITVVLTFVLLPPLGVLGAGVAWCAGQSAGCLLVLWDVMRGRRRSVIIAPGPLVG